jgi:pilus assembly protein Flp/PilA
MDNFLSVQTLILVLATYLVAQGIKSLSGLVGVDLSGYGAAWTAAIVALVMGIFQTLVAPKIPVEYVGTVEAAASVVLGLLGAMGVHRTVKGFQETVKAENSSTTWTTHISGQGMVEYALILVLVAVVVLAALTIMGPLVNNVFATINAGLVATPVQ